MLEVLTALAALATTGMFLLEFSDRFEIRQRARPVTGRKVPADDGEEKGPE